MSNNPERNMKLDISIESTGFLNNIIEYGNNRMARRAVGILQKMPSYRIIPQEIHYTEAIWACEKSDQFQLALSVYDEMVSLDIPLTSYTYQALISVAEKTNHCEEVLQYFEEMKQKKLSFNTQIFNSVLMSLDKVGKYELSFEILEIMKATNTPRDMVTYTACAAACERAGEGQYALQVLDLMKEDGVEVTIETYNAVLWACVRQGLWEETLRLFNALEDNDKKVVLNQKRMPQKNERSYNAAIWACEMGGLYNKAVELLRLMKFQGLNRQTMSFDGAISSLRKAKKWEIVLDIMNWMARDKVEKSYVTYKLAMEVLEETNQSDLLMKIYLDALRSGFYNPWITNTRTLDIRSFPLAIAKIAICNVFDEMRRKRLDKFNLNIIVRDVIEEHEESGEGLTEKEVRNLSKYLTNLNLFDYIKTNEDGNSNSNSQTIFSAKFSSDDDIDTDMSTEDDDDTMGTPVGYRQDSSNNNSSLKTEVSNKSYMLKTHELYKVEPKLDVSRVTDNDGVKLVITRDSIINWIAQFVTID
eukprot:gene10017-13473_t